MKNEPTHMIQIRGGMTLLIWMVGTLLSASGDDDILQFEYKTWEKKGKVRDNIYQMDESNT